MKKTLVFIPSYNDHAHLDEIIDYVLELSADHFVLLVDDGSEIPIRIKSNSHRVYTFRIPYNAGLGIGLNIALDFAKFKQFDIRNGPYGPYIFKDKKFISIPKDKDPTKLTHKDCLEIIKNHKPKPKFRKYNRKKK